MKILHTSDWHLGKMLENINRIEEQKEFINYLCEVVETESIDLVLIAGDIFDTYTPSSAAEELFYEAVDRLSGKGRRAIIVIAGNHDSPERLCAASPLAYKNGIILLGYPGSDAGEYSSEVGFTMAGGNISIVASGPGWLELSVKGCRHNVVVITLPYPSESRLEEVISQTAEEDKLQRAYSEKIGAIFQKLSAYLREDTVNLAVAHLFIRFGKESESERVLQVGGAMTVDPGVLPGNAHYVALGHLHRPQRVKDAPCPAYYSGSPLAYSFSETDYSKALYIVNAEPGREPEIRDVLLNCGKPLRRWIAKNGLEEAMQWCQESRDINCWIDLEIYTDRAITMEEQKKLRELNPGIINIRPVVKSPAQQVMNYENRENKRMDELFMEFYKHRTGMEVSEELMVSFLEVLNSEEREESEDITGGEGDEAKIS